MFGIGYLTPRTYTQFELSAKINIFLPFGVAFNSLLSVTSVNLTGSEHTFILAQLIFQSWSAAGTEDSASTLAVFDSYSVISMMFRSTIISDLPVKRLS